jgi:hypothetical protein
LVAIGDSFAVFAAGQVLIGTSMAFASGTDEAMLYESLAATGRADEIEKQEIIAWRYSFSALALSALTGGALALIDPRLPFVGGALAFGGLFWITMRFVEPPRSSDTNEGSELLHLSGLGASFQNPVLLWFFVLGVVMYGFSHLPFVFGQQFILEALNDLGLASIAPPRQRRGDRFDDGHFRCGVIGRAAIAPHTWPAVAASVCLRVTNCDFRRHGPNRQRHRTGFPAFSYGAGRPVTPLYFGPHSTAADRRQPRHVAITQEFCRSTGLCHRPRVWCNFYNRRRHDALR